MLAHLLNDEFYISDLLEVKVFTKDGKLTKRVASRTCALTVYDDSVFYCNFNDCTWNRLVFE
jgi:hypothetical protein